MRILALLALCSVIAVPASAFPVQVNFRLYDNFTGPMNLLGTGGFIFDTDSFNASFSSLVPAEDLIGAGADITAGPHAGQHWDFSSVTLTWVGVQPPPNGVFAPGLTWGWQGLTTNGIHLPGDDADGWTEFTYDGQMYAMRWSASEATLPEPSPVSLFGAGVVLAVLIGRRSRS
jgi:hypothetical protein